MKFIYQVLVFKMKKALTQGHDAPVLMLFYIKPSEGVTQQCKVSFHVIIKTG